MSDAPPGMAWIPGGTFRMGSDEFYPEEAPVREVAVEGSGSTSTRSPSPSSAASRRRPAT